ncbi:COG complex component [Basidiobolus meristosporus CBS 931.73]|uniref:Conserved oligomeric Golgi complex subunit 2 n=1 Tax=Basidiobolus meristosporus CBS 931.73 TaxID=1314790 RepID=A0A1Y1XZF2_9FUNG|nr:COG complex component [Basidiobolus meristosporus CBS 931.73]|eukprot:ORX91112.1 COG complex component [Basidiobolus meristosporus CBS 931.73]
MEIERYSSPIMNGKQSSLPMERSSTHRIPFDSETFLTDRRHMPLQQIKEELEFQLAIVKNHLVELINKDYTEFLDLVTNLVDVDKVVDLVREPLKNTESEVKMIRDNMISIEKALEEKLNYRSSIREKKASLQLILNLAHSVEKIEYLLKEEQLEEDSALQAENPQSTSTATTISKFMERIAMEYNQIRYYVKKGKDLPFVAQMEPRIEGIKKTLQTRLSSGLQVLFEDIAQGRQSADTLASLTQNLRTYALIDRAADAEEIFRLQFVAPFIRKVVTPEALGGKNEADKLRAMFDNIIDFASTKCSSILNITQNVLRGTEYELLIHGIWKEVIDNINQNLAKIYSTENPDCFQLRYKLAVDFVMRFEKLCASRKTFLYLRAHPSYQGFMASWELKKYYQTRLHEISRQFEETLQRHGREIEGKVLPATQSLIALASYCWTDEVYLDQLAPSFWRLTFQLLARYKSWMDDLLSEFSEQGGIQLEKSRSQTSPYPSSTGMSRSTSTPSNSVATGVTSEDSVLKYLAALSHDINHVHTEFERLFHDRISRRLPSDPIYKQSLDDALHEITSKQKSIGDRVTQCLIKKCSDQLRLVRNVTGQYRHTNRKPPTQSSPYVQVIFGPVVNYFHPENSHFDSSETEKWTEAIANAVTSKFAAILSELLTTLQRTEESLKRLKKGKRTGTALASSLFSSSGAASTLSDEDKIRLQLLLDVKRYQQELAKLGVPLEKIQDLDELRNTVSPYQELERT